MAQPIMYIDTCILKIAAGIKQKFLQNEMKQSSGLMNRRVFVNKLFSKGRIFDQDY